MLICIQLTSTKCQLDMRKAPYTVALVKLEEGPIVTTQLTDPGSDRVDIGTPVEMVNRRLRSDGHKRGMLGYGYKFRPVLHKQADALSMCY
ncbi:MAG: OB-fold domain-containing protein [Anaerolineales bacterium]|nr:OB-fold domain-containing protein [Anaerolineales bacterium]